MSTDQQERSERQLALLQVTHAVPYHALESEEMKAFCRGLSTKFVVPSRRSLQRRVGELCGESETTIDARLKVCIHSRCAITYLMFRIFEDWKRVHLAIDGWEDNQKTEIVAVVAMDAARLCKPVLIEFKRLNGRQTTEILSELLSVCLASMNVHCKPPYPPTGRC